MSKKTKQTERTQKNAKKGGTKLEKAIRIPSTLPVLTAKDLVAFPGVMMSLFVSRAASMRSVERALSTTRQLFVVAQQNSDVAEPTAHDLYTVGVVAHIVRTLTLPDGRLKVLAQGMTRAEASAYGDAEGVLIARIKEVQSSLDGEPNKKDKAIINRIRENLQVLVQHEQRPEEILLVTEEITDPGQLSDIIIAHYALDASAAQTLLEQFDARARLRATDELIAQDLQQFLISEQVREQARDEMNRGQREYFLREQVKLINRELGEGSDTSEDIKALKESLAKAKLPPHAKAEADKQMRRLERMQPEASEYALIRTYLECLVELPWSLRTKDNLDVKNAKRVLADEHFGLEKAKDRIIEYLSVLKLKNDSRGPILCFVGPPGVGKTSLGKSIANALGRKFVRVSLGGMRDEAEIRGHRRTYVGAMSGRILSGIKQAGSHNCVFVLDELDKVGADFRGDPAAALLEVLDPQQNKEFMDHYLGIPFDLSEVMFIATANTLDTIPDALVDRLEIIPISGYTVEEKMHISKRFLMPRQRKENGIEKRAFKISDEALTFLIERYTLEAGVRGLEREVGSLCRKLAREVVEGRGMPSTIDLKILQKLLGATKVDPETRESGSQVGLVRGLAWTINGGEVMPIEASTAKGSGTLQLTGQLGSVMQESAQAALFYARSHAKELGLDPEFHGKYDLHVHVPGGATPKDGPSAGITIATAVVSALANRPVSKDLAMTGEITLRGNVLAIGGLKEKALAALRYGITRIIIPQENVKDLEDIPKEQREKIQFIPVKHIGEVLKVALLAPVKVQRKITEKMADKKIKPVKRKRPTVSAHV